LFELTLNFFEYLNDIEISFAISAYNDFIKCAGIQPVSKALYGAEGGV